jgi:stage II sporulation protein D
MKQYIIITVIFVALLFATTLIFGTGSEAADESEGSGADNPPQSPSFDFPRRVPLLLSESGEILDLSLEDYLIGCLFAQIPVDYHEQALKAQAIAAHTYLLRLLANGNVISDNPETCQPFFCPERSRTLFRDMTDYDYHLERVRAAARYGTSRALFHGGQPIYAVYHSLSAGVTNTAYSVWGVDFPYLRSTDSSWDREHRDFICTNEMSAESIRLAMFGFNRTAAMPICYDDWFTEPYLNEFGYVISIGVGENRLSGGDTWRALGLRSTAFSITRRDMSGNSIFVIETRGFGHGVGLSQYGADVLARRGWSYAEILNHYYTNVELVDFDN